jgi:hypothetical protein
MSASSLNDRTCEPTMCEHVFRVNTLRMKGFCSPGNHFCQVQFCVWHPSDRKKTLPSDHVSYLDDRIRRCFRKDSFSTRTFNIEAQYPENNMKGCWIKTLPPNSNLQLTMRPSTVRSGDGVFGSWYLNPIHSDNL